MYFAWSRPIIGFWWTISGLCICNVQFSIRKSTKAPGAFRTFLQHTPPLLLQRKRTLLCLLNIESLPNWAEIGYRKKWDFQSENRTLKAKKTARLKARILHSAIWWSQPIGKYSSYVPSAHEPSSPRRCRTVTYNWHNAATLASEVWRSQMLLLRWYYSLNLEVTKKKIIVRQNPSK